MKKILIVEDDDALLRAMRDRLVLAGFSTLLAKDGIEGLSAAIKKHPDLILLDVMMPKMDGMKMLNKLRTDEWGKTVPVIVLTNLNETRDVADALDRDISEYLVKTDWTLEEIIKKIKQKLKKTV